MTNRERIQANNAELRVAIEMAEKLPDAETPLDVEPYEGEYSITPKVDAQKMQTMGKLMINDVTIKAIPFFNVSNTSGGNTVYIGNEV